MLAIIVSYNGSAHLRESVEALAPQVGRILIVDNGSRSETLDVLDVLETAPDVSVIRLGMNRGIGHALNVGASRAREWGHTWLLTMDQDSVVQPGMLTAFAAALAAHPEAACLAPRLMDTPRRGDADVHEIEVAITSGNLVRVDIVEAIGGYDEMLFIDGVDFDFSLRLRTAGHRIHEVVDALMVHRLGDARRRAGVLDRYYARHAPLRRYYMSRNFFYLVERHARRFPLFFLKLAASHALLMVLVAFRDPRPWASYRAVLRGIRDYIAGKSGPHVESVA